MKQILIPGVLVAACALAFAKLPPLDDAAKAKAAENAAKAAWQGKVDGWLVCKAQDRVAAQYLKTAGKTVAAAGKPAATPAAPPAAPVAAASAAQAAASGTPVVAYKPPGACADPGPFAYNAPEQKPLESSGAHSPAGNATSPPSVKQPSADMTPAKK